MIVQLDFAENYGAAHQDKILSVLWSHHQITLFACCARLIFCICFPKESDQLCQIRIQVIDNCKSDLGWLCWENRKQIKFWHLYATCHGKGAVDGVGGMYKHNSGGTMYMIFLDLSENTVLNHQTTYSVSFWAQYFFPVIEMLYDKGKSVSE
ncbi:hypothetical protein PR048_016206 [Dryococelus australis]|uniref:Uncharacterized protein n=1 Tax=Dryococelus australis TaxID=614101 RepID=A0ABQ9HJH3_9NEOP|nr:hypothetical protein PR048_016206 [Dryococelus australis]